MGSRASSLNRRTPLPSKGLHKSHPYGRFMGAFPMPILNELRTWEDGGGIFGGSIRLKGEFSP
jgi:hypothetical protein